MKTHAVPVVFRIDRSKASAAEHGPTAVFDVPREGTGCWPCYAHVGQHSACSQGWYYTTRPATPDEYADLLRELQGIYEGAIVVRQRMRWLPEERP